MTLPVSSYEELLARVRSLTCETIQLRREITSSLCEQPILCGETPTAIDGDELYFKNYSTHPEATFGNQEWILGTFRSNAEILMSDKQKENDIELKDAVETHVSSETKLHRNDVHRIGCATDNLGLWHSGPSSFDLPKPSSNTDMDYEDLKLSVSYESHESLPFNSCSASKRSYSHQQLGAKVEMVYSLLSMLDTDNREDMSRTFLAMSSSPESCHAMRQSGCLPLLIQLIHSSEVDKEVRNRAAEALHNIVYSQSDEKQRKREMRVLKLLQTIREYCEEIKMISAQEKRVALESEKHPVTAMGTVMKFSFDAEHRQAICSLGGLHAISELIEVDNEVHGSTNEDTLCITLRRYAGMSLTNLTFGDGKNKALLCSFHKFMRALVDQLRSPSEDLRQVTASVLRNLSWRADSESKQTLRQVGAVTALTVSAMEGKKESTLKSILSALWNLSAHCSLNKIDICSVPGALAFLVKMLKFKSVSNTLAIIENAGGILRNISSHIAVREDYRQILRDHNCFEILLEQLKSPSLTVVSNACGTLWNLSARCSEDQKRLWEMGATTMLRSLVQSKHKMISLGSSAALKNLMAANPNENLLTHLDSTAKSLGLQNLPTLFARKQRALEQELNITLAETCDNIELNASPTHMKKQENPVVTNRSDSRDSVISTQSDSVCERITHTILKKEDQLLSNRVSTLHESLNENQNSRNAEDKKFIRRYKTSLIPTPTFKKVNQDKVYEKAKDSIMDGIVNKTTVEVSMTKNTGLMENKRGIPVSRWRPKNKSHSCFESLDHQSSSFGTFSPQQAEEYSTEYAKYENLIPERNNSSVEVKSTRSVEAGQRDNFNVFVWEKISDEEERIKRFLKSDVTNEKHADGELGFCKPGTENLNPKVIAQKENLTENSLKTIPTQSDNNSKQMNSNSNLDKKVTGKSMLEQVNLRNEILECSKHQNNVKQECQSSDGTGLRDESSGKFEKSEEEMCRDQNIKQKLLKNDKCLNFPRESERSPESSPPNNIFMRSSEKLDSAGESATLGNPKSQNKYFEDKAEVLLSHTLETVNAYGFLKRDSDTIPVVAHGEIKNVTDNQKHLCDDFKNEENLIHKNKGDMNSIVNLYKNIQPFNSYDNDRRAEIESNFGQNPCKKILEKSYGASGKNNTEASQSEEMAATEGDISYCCKSDTFKQLQSIDPHFENDILTAKQGLCSEKEIDEGCYELISSANEYLEKLNIENAKEDCVKKSINAAVPNFKIGSQLTDLKALQYEANKICHEIQRHQDIEMGCSLTSEVSLVSCSSFLDTGDYSLVEFSCDGIDFDELENQDLDRSSYNVKNFSFRKSTTSQTAESVSLPSLESLKSEQIEALDLDSSVLSVASLTSEMADTYTINQDDFNFCTKKYRNECPAKDMEETLADEDETLNADILQSHTEILDDLDDDNSLHSQENLPSDFDASQKPTYDQSRKLTPKEKRKTFHERYRTYTIRDLKGCNLSGVKDVVSDEGKSVVNLIHSDKVVGPSTSGSDRFPYDICDYHYEDLVTDNKQDASVFHPPCKHETSTFSKICNEKNYELSTATSDPKSFSVLLSVGPAERKELVDNAKMVAFSLKTASQDFEPDLISDTEFDDSERITPIDTTTYNKNYVNDREETFRCQDNIITQEGCDGEDSFDKKGPRILKPTEKSLEEKEEGLSKGIRGRRKQLYSVQKKTAGISSPTASPLKISQTTDIKKPAVSTVKNSQPVPLQREGTFTKDEGTNIKKSEGKGGRSIPVWNRNPEFKGSPSLSSGMKSKTTGILGNSKFACQGSRTRPPSTYSSKNSERHSVAESPGFGRPASTGVGSKNLGRQFSTGSSLQNMKGSCSSQNLRSGATAFNVNNVKSGSKVSKTPISKSTASLNAASSKEKGNKNATKQEVTSKIASLWRKVEETKQKCKNNKDGRIWIKNEKSDEIYSKMTVAERKEILELPDPQIVRSFTCQLLTDQVSLTNSELNPEEGNINRNSGRDLPEHDKRNTQRRNIVSAIVPPYNYNPPRSIHVASPAVDQVNIIQKNPVTTV